MDEIRTMVSDDTKSDAGGEEAVIWDGFKAVIVDQVPTSSLAFLNKLADDTPWSKLLANIFPIGLLIYSIGTVLYVVQAFFYYAFSTGSGAFGVLSSASQLLPALIISFIVLFYLLRESAIGIVEETDENVLDMPIHQRAAAIFIGLALWVGAIVLRVSLIPEPPHPDTLSTLNFAQGLLLIISLDAVYMGLVLMAWGAILTGSYRFRGGL